MKIEFKSGFEKDLSSTWECFPERSGQAVPTNDIFCKLLKMNIMV